MTIFVCFFGKKLGSRCGGCANVHVYWVVVGAGKSECHGETDMNSFAEFCEGAGTGAYPLILPVSLFLCHIVLLLYRGSVMWSAGKFPCKNRREGVSVILTCANDGELLRKNLEAFLNQDYPDYEVIVVDDCSEDNTQDVLSDLQKRYAHLKTTRIFPGTKFRSTKKLAINIGVLAARNDILLFSEIGCRPGSRYWVREMESAFDDNTAVVVGCAVYPGDENIPGIRRYFRFLWFWKTMFLVRCGICVQGNGYNMGYRKKHYLEKRGFTGNTQEYIGFDSQMVKVLSQKGEVRVVGQKEARMQIVDESRKAWMDDCSYHYTGGRGWPWRAKLSGSADFIVEGGLYLSAFYSALSAQLWGCAVVIVILTFVMDMVVTNICLKQSGQKGLFMTSLCANIFGFAYKWYYYVYSMISGRKWR